MHGGLDRSLKNGLADAAWKESKLSRYHIHKSCLVISMVRHNETFFPRWHVKHPI